MDALLILGGLLLMLGGLVWLVMRAFSTSLLWGWASVLPPLTLLYVICHWRRARQAVILCGLGLVPLIVGLAVTANQDPQRFAAIVSLQWLHPEKQEQADLAIQLHGQLNGEPFAPRYGELVDGVLSLREGQDFFASREVVIRGLAVSDEGLRVDVLPADRGDLPEIEISWLQADQQLPEARQLSGGYTLHLNLQPQAQNLLVGDFHLVLPAQLQTTLSGKVELFRNGLRYRDGHIDRQLDNRDTLAYVISDYLQRRFASADVQLTALPTLALPASTLDLSVEADIDGRPQRLSLPLRKHAELGWHVVGDDFAPLAADTAPSLRAAPVASDQHTGESAAPAAPADFSLVALLGDPRHYLNRPMRLVSDQGTSQQGQFAGLDEQGQIVLSQRLNGSGEARFAVHPENVSHIELIDP